jgi:DNA repair exonuclease SbcCD ATPase subunit
MNRMGLLVVVALIVAGRGFTAVAAEEPTEQVRALQMQNELYKKTIQRLQEEIKKLKAEPAQAELEALREELKSAKKQIAELKALTEDTASAKPATQPAVAHESGDTKRVATIGLNGLVSAGREILANKRTDTDAAHKERLAAMRGKNAVIKATLQNVVKRNSNTFLVTVRHESKQRFRYSGTGATMPRETISARLSVGLDSRVATLKKGTTVTVRGTIKYFGVNDAFGRGMRIRIALENGQVNE